MIFSFILLWGAVASAMPNRKFRTHLTVPEFTKIFTLYVPKCSDLMAMNLIDYSSGDSYTTIGFQYAGSQPNASNPIGNPALPGKTTSGGYNWVGNLVAKYNKSLVLAYDFAIAGATVDSNLIPPYQPAVKSFVQQVQIFQGHYLNTSGTWNLDDSLFTAWFGMNDIPRGENLSDWTTTIFEETIQQYLAQAQNLYYVGSRYFVFLEVPPLQRTPQLIGESAAAQEAMASDVDRFNEAIREGIRDFAHHNREATVWLLNTTKIFNEALDNPTAYGAPNALCYNSNGVSCLWWNDYHPGKAIQDLVAKSISSLIKSRAHAI